LITPDPAATVTSTNVPTNSMISRIHNGRDLSVSSSNRIRYRRPSDAACSASMSSVAVAIAQLLSVPCHGFAN